MDIPSEHENHSRYTIMTGVSGCGKDFLIAKMKEFDLMPPSISSISFGEELFTLLKTNNPAIQSRDDIKRMLSQDQVRAGVLALCDRLMTSQPAIINTHVVYRQQDSLAFNPDILRRLNPTNFVYVWSDPEQIRQWRQADMSRNRPNEDADDIDLHQCVAMETTRIFAEYCGSGMRTIWNREDNVLDNIDRIQDSLRQLKSSHKYQMGNYGTIN